jgi:hypothetical protein
MHLGFWRLRRSRTSSNDIIKDIDIMQLPTAIQKQHRSVYGAVFLTILIPLYYVSWQHHTALEPPSRVVRPNSTDFVADWLDVRLIDDFNPSAIEAYCKTTEWRPNLVFNLENANGGYGNVRINILDFLFQAIEAGASIMIPGINSRSQTDIVNLGAGRVPFDHFFDEAWFISAMSTACPQMKIYKPDPDKLLGNALGSYHSQTRRLDQDPQNTRKASRAHLDAWITSQKPDYDPSDSTSLNLVNLGCGLWEVDTRSLPSSFRRSFPQVLRFSPSIRRLAALTVQSLALAYPSILLDPRDPTPPKAFHGSHLRTEADALAAGWNGADAPNCNYSSQTDAYISHALAHKLRVMYVASGNASELERFTAKAAAHRPPLTVTTKLSLLPRSALEELDALAWDQQALVDYQVLARSSVFAGFVKSSFSFGLVVARAQRLSDEGRVVMDPFGVRHMDPDVCWDDPIGRLVGRDNWHERQIPRGQWP